MNASTLSAIAALAGSMPNLKDLQSFNEPQSHSRHGKRMKVERLYSAQVPKDKAGNVMKNVRVLPSGSAYQVHASGAWICIKHPQNKHERNKAKAIAAFEAEHGRAIKH
jgi:hypothetical protein